MSGFASLPAMLGISSAAGLDATLPALFVAVLARAGVVTLPPPFAGLGSWYAIAALAALCVVNLLGGRRGQGSSALLSGNSALGHAVESARGPATMVSGAVLAAAQGGGTAAHPVTALTVVGLLLGAAVAGFVHAGRGLARALTRTDFPGARALGRGIGKAEDLLALLLAALAIFSPYLAAYVVFLLIALFVLVAVAVMRRMSTALREIGARYGFTSFAVVPASEPERRRPFGPRKATPRAPNPPAPPPPLPIDPAWPTTPEQPTVIYRRTPPPTYGEEHVS